MFHFPYPWKLQKNRGFLTFSGGIVIEHWRERVKCLIKTGFVTLSSELISKKCVYLSYKIPSFYNRNQLWKIYLLFCEKWIKLTYDSGISKNLCQIFWRLYPAYNHSNLVCKIWNIVFDVSVNKPSYCFKIYLKIDERQDSNINGQLFHSNKHSW